QHQLAYGSNHIGRGAGALPAPPPRQAYLGVDPANPMDEQNDLGCIGIDIGNHLMDHGADDALLQPCIGRGGGPNALESAASVANDAGSTVDGTVAASWAAILASPSATRASALFHRASSSPVTNRLAGSANPQWRHPPAARQKRCNAARHCPSSRGCSCSAECDASLLSSGGSIYARIGDSGAGPPTKPRRAWAHHGGGSWVRSGWPSCGQLRPCHT